MSERVTDAMFGAFLMLALIVALSSTAGMAYKFGFDDGQKAAKGRGE